MIVTFIIFILAVILAFGMLFYRAWEIRTSQVAIDSEKKVVPTLYWRNLEKNGLYITKHVVQWVILSSVKVWFTFTTKTKIWFQNKWPKIHDFFIRKNPSDSRKISFIQRAIIESKIKIKRIKEKIKEDHKEAIEEAPKEDNNSQNIPVDNL